MSKERIETNPHKFWMTTCGLDTYGRSKDHARLDTPWNAFTEDKTGLVNSIWVDRVVSVFDTEKGHERQFVILGAKVSSWKGLAVKHGEEAQRNLEIARAARIPVYGFEVEPKDPSSGRDDRGIKHFWLDRVHLLHPVYGISGMDLKDRLQIDSAFREHIQNSDVEDMLSTGHLFELLEPRGDVPGAAQDGFEEDDLDAEPESLGWIEETARKILPVLVEHVLRQRDDVLVPLTYKELAQRIGRFDKNGRPWPRGLGKVLGRVTSLISAAAVRMMDSPPFLTTIVVLSQGQYKGLPSHGIKGTWMGYDLLNAADKRAKVTNEYSKILEFGSRWLEVLRLTGLEVASVEIEASVGNSSSGGGGGWGGGESAQHKALKEYVVTHPEQFGAGPDWFVEPEHDLRSGDVIDVVFKSEHLWIGVEVKSRISDGGPIDYERGVYQAIKYAAVLEAQARVDHPGNPPAVRIILAVETVLPLKSRQLAIDLGVEYLERVSSAS
ncbi:hypothetical protein [Achromobacter sp. ESBL13]|uniref:hypothetical protein n=1 Tax=Achromobacter sp. ESBL13 TaxID=3077328 RepID=UPI002FC8A913